MWRMKKGIQKIIYETAITHVKDNRTWATTMMARKESLGSLEGFIRGKSTGFNDWFDLQFEMY